MNNIFITGVSRGIGKSLYKKYLEKGSKVWGTLRNTPVELFFKDLGLMDLSNAETIDLDLSNLKKSLEVGSKFGASLDILILNAATFGSNSYTSSHIDEDDFQKTIAVNVISNYILALALKKSLLMSATRKVIFITSGNGSIGGNKEGEMLSYRVSKAALNQLSRTLAIDWRNEDFIVTALNPGWVKTDMGGDNAEIFPDEAANNIFEFIDGLKMKHSGLFLNTNYTELPW